MTEKALNKQVKPTTNTRLLQDIMSRGVSDIIPRKLFEKKLKKGEKMRIYYGVDPTGPFIHLGHAIYLWKLRQLQELGHEIILLIGDFTARIGDPTDRSAARIALTPQEVLANAKTYKKQAAKILRFSGRNPVKIKYNSTWLDKLKFADVIELSAQFTVQQMMERDMFQKRLKEAKPIYVHEFLYPIMQGYDSVAMGVDVEMGGTDQLFNMLTGRTMLLTMKQKEKIVMTFDLLAGLDGRKMSKGFGNIIGVTDEPNDMFGKVMAMQDDLILPYFWLCANVSKSDMEGIEYALRKGENPRDIKLCLARKIVTLYHGLASAGAAEKEFAQVFQKKNKPTDIPTHQVSQKTTSLIDLVVAVGFAGSKGEARRLIEQGGVRADNKKITDTKAMVKIKSGQILQVGKRHFVK